MVSTNTIRGYFMTSKTEKPNIAEVNKEIKVEFEKIFNAGLRPICMDDTGRYYLNRDGSKEYIKQNI